MQLAHWNPFREMDDLMSRFQRGFGRSLVGADALPQGVFAPAVDISEMPKESLLSG